MTYGGIAGSTTVPATYPGTVATDGTGPYQLQLGNWNLDSATLPIDGNKYKARTMPHLIVNEQELRQDQKADMIVKLLSRATLDGMEIERVSSELTNLLKALDIQKDWSLTRSRKDGFWTLQVGQMDEWDSFNRLIISQ